MSTPNVRVPVLATVDVAVVGASTGTVSAALAIRESGASAMAVSDRPYFGEETAGRLEMWRNIESGDPLLKSLASARPLTPGLYKRTMEMALLRENIPFLFLTRPVAVLRDVDGQLGGLVLASRTTLYAVRAKCIIDATAFGLVARLAGITLPAERSGQESAELIVLATQLPAEWQGRAQADGPSYNIPNPNPKYPANDTQAYRLRFGLPRSGGSVAELAALEHQLRAEVVSPHILYSGDIIPFQPARALGSGSFSSDPLILADDAFRAGDRLYHLGGNLPLTPEGLSQLGHPEVLAHLGRRIGQNAARAASSIGWTPVAAGPSSGENYLFAEPFLRNHGSAQFVEIALPAQPILGSRDVIVAGGGTGGASAGISAARTGASTAVLEVQHGLGGVGTLGLIASYYFGNRVGFTTEIDTALARLEGRDEDLKPRGDWNTELKMSWYNRALAEAGGQAWLRSFAFGVRMEGDRVDGVLVSTPYGSGLLEAGCVVDSTGNADIAAAAGAPCRVIGARHVAVQGAGLSPRCPGAHYRNSDHTFIDDSDVAGVTHAFVNARAKFPDEFDTAALVDTRERRQIQGEIELSPLDFLAERQFPDTINVARSNFDTHGFTVHPVFLVVPPNKEVLSANVPYRCLLPRGVEGVIVTGLGMSAHRDAIPVIRMQPDVQNQGYAAGLAASMAAAGNGRLRDVNIRDLQKKLVEKAVLTKDYLTQEDNFPLPASALEAAVSAGLGELFHVAVLFANPDQAIPLLLKRLAEETDPERRLDVALALGLLGREEAAPILAEAVSAQSAWDEGWNFRGMGQFGLSTSRQGALVIALGRTGSPLAVEPVLHKIRTLGEDPAFSHCRAVALATACLQDARLATALAELLQQPGIQGHAHLETAKVVKEANDDHIETAARTHSLRELYLARGLYLAGDVDGLGRRILETYAKDLRGPYARHAIAILAGEGADAPRTELA